ncbi:MAG: hypothetical protein AAF438_13180 [Pseudomonadota bacterium]
MTNVVDPGETNGYHLTYLPKYVLSTDQFLRKSESEIAQIFLEGVKTLFPGLDDSEIVDLHIHKAIKVQPLQVVDYSKLVPDWETKHPNFFILNTSQFVNNTLNNNEVVRLVSNFLQRHASMFESSQEAA